MNTQELAAHATKQHNTKQANNSKPIAVALLAALAKKQGK